MAKEPVSTAALEAAKAAVAASRREQARLDAERIAAAKSARK